MGVPVDVVLYDMSWQNLILYSAATPQFDDEDKKEKKWDESLDANNPENNIGNEDEIEYVPFN